MIFEKPATFAVQSRSTSRTPASPSDMTGILADRIREFLVAPAAYTGLSSIATTALFADLDVWTDPEDLRVSGKNCWIFLTPSPVPSTSQRQSGLTDIGVLVTNSSMPPSANKGLLHTQYGNIPQRSTAVMERAVTIGISLGTRAGTMRAGDALYLWLVDMLCPLRLDLQAFDVKLSPLQNAAEEERPLFAPFSGDPATIQVVATAYRQSFYTVPDPP